MINVAMVFFRNMIIAKYELAFNLKETQNCVQVITIMIFCSLTESTLTVLCWC